MIEKLIELIIEAKRTDPETGSFTEYLADFLIKNGVTSPVRCGECKHHVANYCTRDIKGRTNAFYMEADDYCSYGKPKESEE